MKLRRLIRTTIWIAAVLVCSTMLLATAVAMPGAWPEFDSRAAGANIGNPPNSPFAQPGVCISKDGLSLFFHSDGPGGFGGTDLWVLERRSVNDPWDRAQNLGPNINTSSDESGPTLSHDGRRLYFISNRHGGLGDADVWVSRRDNPRDNLGWQTPENLGSAVNSPFQEGSFALFEDEHSGILTIYFSSNRAGGFDSNDIYASELQPNGTFGSPSLVFKLSRPMEGQTPNMRKDGQETILASSHPGAPKAAAGGLAEDSWAPPDLDESVPPVNPGAACALPDVLKATSARLVELVANLEKFTATERIEYAEVTRKGATVQRKARAFSYVVSLQEIRPRMLSVEEYRNGDSGSQVFFMNLATNGLPALVLLFHPYYTGDFDMQCEGLSEVHGEPAWRVYFRQRADRPSRVSGLRVGFQSYSIDLKGRAWISARTAQVLRLEADILNPVKATEMKRLHKIIEYQKVRFEKSKVEIWLPARAEVYMHFRGHRYQIRHSFSDFLLFGVDVKYEISAPPNPEREVE